MLRRFGVIPNGSRYYFLSRSQPPFFTQMVRLALKVRSRSNAEDGQEWLTRMLDLAEAEHAVVWSGTAQPHHRLVHEGLSRYFDINFLHMLASCESGWDHSTRCDDRWLDHLPVDLNCILHVCERDMADFARMLGDEARAQRWEQRAALRAETIRRLMWDATAGYYLDYDYVNARRTPTPTLAGFYALWSGVATPEQAERMITEWLPRFEQPGGLVTSLAAQAGRQWAWPNGWAPLQWIVVQGLENYGHDADARRIRTAWCDLCASMYERTGVLWEKYNVVSPGDEGEEGLYGHVKGFGWTNGVFVDFVRALERGRID
jgi:alpha,alpha-trehalase